MEDLAQALQDALGTALAVYLGPEHLDDQPELPHVIVVPTAETLTPPTQNPQQLVGDSAMTVDVICRAVTYQDARTLALLCWTALMPLRARPTAAVQYGSEPWGDYTVRSAVLTVTVTAPVLRSDVTLARIEEIAAHHRYLIPATQQEVSNDQEPEGGTYRGDFHEHADPVHRL
ncbi:hypothetical protein [Deinococcus arenicola]|uniref:DUF3168 domain-containing protein n=1 Tax=Deinococcus arenicola TaxID=2994950 RepID=A0ABU4DWQ1_9DEIO|nr:hypothetical protein [Deinococcus sp. ZS9-10]MDV6376372.1 hypothetical protein [Deinococcus sp. ZS9-10]